MSVSCGDCGQPAFSCPCAVADNDATGQGDEVERDGLWPYFGPEDDAA